MTDLTAGLIPENTGLKEFVSLTLTSGQKVYQGGLAAVATTGKLVNGTGGTSTLKIIGTFMQDYDASASGANADITVLVRVYRPFAGVWLTNYVSDPVVVADISKQIYVQDNHQVCHTAGSNAVAGICWGLNTTKGTVLVELLAQTATQAVLTNTVDSTLPAWTSNDWAPTGASLVSGTTYVIPTTGAASTVTLPVTGVADGTEVKFFADGTKNGHTVTYRQSPSTAITAALAANKRHLIIAESIGNTWAVNAYATP